MKEITLSGKTAELKEMAGAAGQAQKQVQGLCQTLRETLKIRGHTDYWQTAGKYGKDMADDLLTLQLRMGQLRKAMTEAAMPLASVFVPAINSGALALTRFLQTLSGVLRVLLTGETKEITQASAEAEKSQKNLGKTVKKTSAGIQRSLAKFDQLERLQRKTIGGSSGTQLPSDPKPPILFQENISPQIHEMAEKVLYYLQPLQNLDFTAVRESFAHLSDVIGVFAQGVGKQLEWLWFRVLVPLGSWVIEEAAPAAVDTLTAAFTLLNAILEPVSEGIRILLEALTPVASFISDVFLEVLSLMQNMLGSLAQTFSDKSSVITQTFQALAQIVGKIWEMVSPVLISLKELFTEIFGAIWQEVNKSLGWIIECFHDLVTFLNQIFNGEFDSAWASICEVAFGWIETLGEAILQGLIDPVRLLVETFEYLGEQLGGIFEGVGNIIRGVANGIIGLINGLISGIVAGFNALADVLNIFSLDIPEWVPLVGGGKLGFDLPHFTAPQIPYLAQGAVLPANRPFLAMVGDQSHGTNVEAPLATIQEAVANVIGDMTGGMMAGFEAVVRAITDKDISVTIGDDEIYSAYESASRKMNVMEGGGLF